MRAAEFFAGMGLTRAALERCDIETVFANDVDKTKAALYRENWGSQELHIGDIRSLKGHDIPTVDIATSSFPCVDLSLAGWRAGLDGHRSSVIFDFCRILKEMGNRAPSTVMIENVPGFLTANDGKDFKRVVGRLRRLGYKVRHICVDAAAFVPQSRRRVFIIGSRTTMPVLPTPPSPRSDLSLSKIVSRSNSDWWSPSRIGKFLDSLSPIQAERVADYRAHRRVGYYGAFRRTRKGCAVWEVRADHKAGALRTTRGGSAKQALVRAGRGEVAVRWMGVGEYASLQGAEYLSYTSVTPQQAMFALGDAVCVPVVEWLGRNCLLPLMR